MPAADQPHDICAFDALLERPRLNKGDVTAAIQILCNSELGLPHASRSDGALTGRVTELLNRAHRDGALTADEAKQVLDLSIDMVNRILKGELGNGHYAVPELAVGWCEIAARASAYAGIMGKALGSQGQFQDLSKFHIGGT